MPSEPVGSGYQVATQQYDFPTVSLHYSSKGVISKAPAIKSSLDARNCFLPYFMDCLEHHEEFYVLLLNRASKVLGICQIGKGGLTATVADPKFVFQAAILSNASQIILAHNHPSGQLQPSESDLSLTKRIAELAKLFDMVLLDHLILTADGYFSFAEEGHL